MGDPWWDGFFDRRYTDEWAAAGAFDATAQEVAGVLALVGGAGGLRILDVPCGFGRHAGLLHAAGHEVTGLDLSADQLAIAAERNPGPSYVRGDMRRPPPGPYDVVLNLFSSIGYVDDDVEDLAAIRAWHEVLVPDGVLVIETNHRDRLAKIAEDGAEHPIGTTGGVEFGHVAWVTGRAHRTVRFVDGTERHFDVRMYTATELVGMVREAGFAEVEVFGGLEGGPLSPDTRLVIRARRR